MSPEIPRQKHMFSGEWEDARSAKQRQQDDERAIGPGTRIPMFNGQEVSPSTANGQPEMDAGPHSDQLRLAELLLDTDTPLAEDPLDTYTEDDITPDNWPARTEYELYSDLVRLNQEHAETLWIDPLYAGRYTVEITQLALEARAAGLSVFEIETAKQIGTWRGSKQKQSPQ